MPQKRQRLIFCTILALLIISLSLTLIQSYRYQQDKAYRETLAFDHAKREAFVVAVRINRELAKLATLTKSIANDLTNEDLEHRLLAERLRKELSADPDIFGLGAAYEPGAYKANVQLYAPYYVKDDDGDFKRIQVEDYYDYTQSPSDDPDAPDTSWYHLPMSKGATWIEPYFGTAAGTFLVEYLAPFYRFDPNSFEDVPIGVIYADYSLDALTDFIGGLDLGAEGYSYIISQQGQYIAHPKKELLGRTIFEVAEELQDEDLRRDGERATRGKIFHREGVDAITGQRAWIFYEPIPLAGWSIGIVLDKNARAAAPSIVIRSQIWIALTLGLSVLFSVMLLFRIERGKLHSLWATAITCAVLSALGIGFVWYLVISNPPYEDQSAILTNTTSLNEHLEAVDTRFQNQDLASPFRIPTGIIVETITLGSDNEIETTGYVWQKYSADLAENITWGFVMPAATRETVSPAYQFHQGDQEIIGWSFKTTLRQHFNASNFPFDRADVQIRLWPKSLNQNVILMPDLSAYEFINPSQQPGLAPQLDLAGWNIERSFFSYKFEDYNADFGSPHMIKRDDIPELTFTVSAHRQILSSLIAHAIRPIVVMALLFGILTIAITSNKAFSAMSYSAALFFIVAIAHVGLRDEMAIEGVAYFEYFYLILYLFILLISLNAILYYSEADIHLIKYKDNLITKLLYWPTLLGLLLIITVITFYPKPSITSPLEILAEDTVILEEAPRFAKQETDAVPVTAEVTPAAQASQPISETRVSLRYLLYDEPPTLDPTRAQSVESIAQINNLFVGLTRLDYNTGEAQPALATEWSTSEDGLTWTFILRDDIAWVHYDPKAGKTTQVTDFDGDPRFVNAHDVIYGIERALDPNTETGLEHLLYVIRNAQEIKTGQDAQGNPTQLTLDDLGIKALNDWTVKFTLAHPAAYFPSILANPIAYPLPEWALNEWQDAWIEADLINTNGPYMLGQWRHNEHIQLVKNPLWVEANAVPIDIIEEPIETDSAVALRMYENDELDSMYAPLDAIDTIRSDPELRRELIFHPELCTYYYGFVHTKPPFNDARVRRAFSAAIDRQFLVDNVTMGGEIPATTFAPPGVFGAPAPGTIGQGYDLELAQASLQEFLNEKELSLAEFNTAYDIVLGYTTSEANAKIAAAIQTMWQEDLGIEVITDTLEWNAYLELIDKTTPIETMYHIHAQIWCADYPDENNWTHEVFNSEVGLNEVRRNCADPNCTTLAGATEFDKLTITAARMTDPSQRIDLYARAEQTLAVDEAAYAPIYHTTAAQLTKPWLVRNYPADGSLDFYNWSIDVEAQK